jgi:hypothetical protein
MRLDPPADKTADKNPGPRRRFPASESRIRCLTLPTRVLLIKKDIDARGRPSGDATSEEVGVLRPDRAAESEGCCQNRPVPRIACAEPLPRFAFEVSIEFVAYYGGQRGHGLQSADGLCGIAGKRFPSIPDVCSFASFLKRLDQWKGLPGLQIARDLMASAHQTSWSRSLRPSLFP